MGLVPFSELLCPQSYQQQAEEVIGRHNPNTEKKRNQVQEITYQKIIIHPVTAGKGL
jgi:hypothetical protein